MQKKSQANTCPVAFGDSLQFMNEKESQFFVKIGALYSELVAISKTGQLHQWKWCNESPYLSTSDANINIHHPKSSFLNLVNEKVIGLATSTIRASVWTESGKIASWLDETVDISYTIKLQTPAVNLFDPAVDSVQQLSVSNLFSVAKLASGNIYWWGIMPYEHRVKLIDKYQSKANKLKHSQTSEITVGSYVSLKTFPLYSSGTIAITAKDGQPKIGQIMEHLFSFKDSKLCKFKLKAPESFREIDKGPFEMPPPALPSTLSLEPISSSLTASTTTFSLSKFLRRFFFIYLSFILIFIKIKERKKPSSSDTDDKYTKPKDEESWPLSEAVFVEDTKPFLLGKVIKIDNDHAIVKMQSKTIPDTPILSGASETLMETQSLLDNCRILAKNQLQVKHLKI